MKIRNFRMVGNLSSNKRVLHMKWMVSKEEKQLLPGQDRPAISILMPFEPKMSSGNELEFEVRLVARKAEREVMAHYPAQQALPVLKKLHHLIRNLNYDTHKKSIALFVSPAIEKIFYLDIPVEEKMLIDQSFEIRDFINGKKQNIQYLAMILGAHTSRIYRGDSSKYHLIKSNTREKGKGGDANPGQQTDPKPDRKELLETFLRQMDEGLSLLLRAYPLPVIVIGPKKIIAHFDQLTKNTKSIVRRIYGNYERYAEDRIQDLLGPSVADWKNLWERNILQQLEKAGDENKLAFGLQAVWREAVHRNGLLLAVEKDFSGPARIGSGPDDIHRPDTATGNRYYIRYAVDDIMEKILECGGDIEFVNNGALEPFDRIALIKKSGIRDSMPIPAGRRPPGNL